MRCLALETSAFTGSVALLESGKTVTELTLPAHERTAQSLVPGITRCLNLVGWQTSHLDLICVTQGPGSFTGLRLGVTTAKVLAYAAGADLIGVNTLRIIAAQAPKGHLPVTSVIDAQRNQLFTATFTQSRSAPMRCSSDVALVDDLPWTRQLDSSVLLTGPGLKNLSPAIPSHVHVSDSKCWDPRAATVGMLACQDHASGKRADLWQFVPNYFRMSAAEEKASQKGDSR
ncbi:MAG: tRNA (adenosine(37)-N6)-threonylcarbamoyltransferase complex dimerization subunit type 1 TsaB [Planctomycetaceae bacterium]|nr:tRNA (adenosine(37)-N6)-threonylcarbamoyltransferase complex dimerization subunit type 1 TsaB [Planctomycetaceae bacterium]MBP63574.1 tRNA (adenosine(37)-N6)-threonylcarbamoyltransferase complex dimerization subunit type 1 TsaB [Planctomycetaceae bacterium]